MKLDLFGDAAVSSGSYTFAMGYLKCDCGRRL
jgi:hypothetical protein